MGFFGSGALRDIAPGLAEFLSRSDSSKMRLLVSPHVTAEDHEAIRTGLSTAPDILARRLQELLGEARVSGRALVRHTLECLAYLVAADKLEFRVALVRRGLFHPKVWLFRTGPDLMVAHGSSNMTVAGLSTNLEHISIARSWADPSQAEIAEVLSEEFDALWQGRRDYAITVDMPRAIREQLLSEYTPSTTPSPNGLWRAWDADCRRGNEPPPPTAPDGVDTQIEVKVPEFRIPNGLNYQDGDFAHQGQAVAAWEAAGHRGILEMATGSGKTVSALIAVQRLYEEVGSLLLVIAAPYLPLVAQWSEEARAFGLRPLVPGSASSQSVKHAKLEGVVRLLNLDLSQIECVIVTHDYLCDPTLHRALAKCRSPIVLVADEVHNLGRSAFVGAPPDFVAHRMGLSATPERQYDDEGTAALQAFFGDVVFTFGLAEAIGKCLVPYDYFVHPVQLERNELEGWVDMTAQLLRLGWKSRGNEGSLPDRLRLLLIRRRRILEEAAGKVGVLRTLLQNSGPRTLRHTLVYATDKGPDQLVAVNALLSELGIMYHQITSEETAQPRLSGDILGSFIRGELQVLTAKRVLDEGVNIPEIGTAYILASTTVQRQWIQRRGRVLRKCSAIGKTSATLHDFLVVPPDNTEGHEREARGLVRQELTRVMEFARLARNAGARGGPLETVQPLVTRWYIRAQSQAEEED